MKKLVCEMCNSTDLVKQDGLYVCQSCGTKYTVEEARKMMIEGPVDVTGSTVKVDETGKIENLYRLARRAKDSGNSKNAQKYYSQIVVDRPNDWEANFYQDFFESDQCTIAEISSAADTIRANLPSTFRLINNELEQEEQKKACQEVFQKVMGFADMATKASQGFYIDHMSADNARGELITRATSIMILLEQLGDESLNTFNDKVKAKEAYLTALKVGATKSTFSAQHFNDIQNKLHKIDSTYEVKQANPNGGCYIATAVYGSYDCPPVWVLRRYRDGVLAKSWYGRRFIHIYYSVSPSLVKWFGHTTLFNKMFKCRLDKMVSNLKNQGIEDTPYNDRNW